MQEHQDFLLLYDLRLIIDYERDFLEVREMSRFIYLFFHFTKNMFKTQG